MLKVEVRFIENVGDYEEVKFDKNEKMILF